MQTIDHHQPSFRVGNYVNISHAWANNGATNKT
jgi:hypothetical protein